MTSAWVVPAVGALGAGVGYASGGPSAATGLAAVFCVLMVIVLAVLYALTLSGRARRR
jgi:hypothetical protein